MCVNFIREWRDLEYNVVFERQIFEKLFHGNFIYSKSFERNRQRIFFFYILFWCLTLANTLSTRPKRLHRDNTFHNTPLNLSFFNFLYYLQKGCSFWIVLKIKPIPNQPHCAGAIPHILLNYKKFIFLPYSWHLICFAFYFCIVKWLQNFLLQMKFFFHSALKSCQLLLQTYIIYIYVYCDFDRLRPRLLYFFFYGFYTINKIPHLLLFFLFLLFAFAFYDKH